MNQNNNQNNNQMNNQNNNMNQINNQNNINQINNQNNQIDQNNQMNLQEIQNQQEQMIQMNNGSGVNVMCKGKFDPQTINSIFNICKNALQSNKNEVNDNLGSIITQNLKAQIKDSEWFVLLTKTSDENYEFNFSGIKNEEILTFSFNQYLIYVCII